MGSLLLFIPNHIHEVDNGLEIALLHHARVVVAAGQGLPDLEGGFGEVV